MRRIFTASLLVCAFCALTQAQTADDAKAVLKQVTDYRVQLNKDFQATGKQMTATDAREMADKVKAKIEDLVKNIDPTKIDPKGAYDWANIYQQIGKDKVACDLAKSFLTTGPGDSERFNAMFLMARSCNNLGEADMLETTLNDIPVPNAANSSTLTSYTAGLFIDTIYEKKGLGPALQTLDTVEKKIKLEDPKEYAKRMLDMQKQREAANPPTTAPKTDEERLKDLETMGVQANEGQIFAFANKRSDLYKEAGKDDEAINVLKGAMAKMDPKGATYRRANAALTMLTLTGTVAPAIVSERSYGTFNGLESLKGKIVIIDFFAHWCGPCIASFPDMEKLYADLHDKGVEVIGVTTYYGYYKTERNLDKDTEYGKMKDFIAEHSIPWPVVYGERANMEKYGITGIPTAIVIDREGKVHKIHVGYSSESFKAFRKEIEELVNTGK